MSNNKTSTPKAKRTLSRLGFRSILILSCPFNLERKSVLWFKLFKHIHTLCHKFIFCPKRHFKLRFVKIYFLDENWTFNIVRLMVLHMKSYIFCKVHNATFLWSISHLGFFVFNLHFFLLSIMKFNANEGNQSSELLLRKLCIRHKSHLFSLDT